MSKVDTKEKEVTTKTTTQKKTDSWFVGPSSIILWGGSFVILIAAWLLLLPAEPIQQLPKDLPVKVQVQQDAPEETSFDASSLNQGMGKGLQPEDIQFGILEDKIITEVIIPIIPFEQTSDEIETSLQKFYNAMGQNNKEGMNLHAGTLLGYSQSTDLQVKTKALEALKNAKEMAKYNIELASQMPLANLSIIHANLNGLGFLGEMTLATALAEEIAGKISEAETLPKLEEKTEVQEENLVVEESSPLESEWVSIQPPQPVLMPPPPNFKGFGASTSMYAWNMYDLFFAIQGMDVGIIEWEVIAVEKAPLHFAELANVENFNVWHIFVTPTRGEIRYPLPQILEEANQISEDDHSWAPYVAWEGTETTGIRWARFIFVGFGEPPLAEGDILKGNSATGIAVEILQK